MFKSLRISSVQMQKYNLTWHTYSDHLRNIFQEIHLDQSSADVTLVTDDKKLLKAHKNILSACSSVFKDMLQLNMSNNHSVIYLRGIQHSEMESILQFIYLGEAKFYEERMNEFLNVAKNLDIRELAKGIEDSDSTAVYENDTNIKTEESAIGADEEAVSSNKDIIEDGRGQHKTPSRAVNREYKHECQQCDQAYKYSDHLTRHIQSVHEGVNYACNQCNYQATRQDSLKRHIQSKH